MPYVIFEVEYLWHGWVKQDVVNTDISNTFDLSLDSPSESASVLFQKRCGFYNVTFRYNALIPKKRRVIPTIKLYAITCSKIICKQKNFYQNFGYSALITINSKINEVNKTRIICIKKTLRERKTLST